MSNPGTNQHKAEETGGLLDRRAFLKDVSLAGVGVTAAAGMGVGFDPMPAVASQSSAIDKLPAHLPRHLTIVFWGWDWLVESTPGKAYYDLDQVFQEHVDRSFNTVRAEVGLDWCFDWQGRPRGPIEVLPWFTRPGEPGARYDVLERVVKMYELAKKHDMHIIQTSWEYQDSTTNVGDPKIREYIWSVPEEERLDRLATQHDRLIQELKKRGLEKQIAFVEVHNELNGSYFPKGWETQKPLAERAIARLRKAHPDILFSADYYNVGPIFEPEFPGFQVLPENMQVAGHHIYTFGIQRALHELTNTWMGKQTPPDPKDNPLLRWLIGDKPKISWEEWAKQADRVRQIWWPLQWLFANMDIDRYDYWMFEHFGQYAGMMRTLIQSGMRSWGEFARDRGIPAVIDEGYIFCPPLNSHFEDSAAGRLIFEHVVDTAIEQGYWGAMLSTYIQPMFPIWRQNPEWIKRTNDRFLNGIKRSGPISLPQNFPA